MDEDTFPDGTRRCCDSYPGTEHDEHCPSPHWPTGDATPERFSLVVNEDRSVTVLDGETRIERYVGTSALADAIRRCMELKRREALGLDPFAATPAVTPEKFLAETLPAYARTQRLEGMLAEVRAAESSTLAGLTEAITLLNRAVSLRERLEKALEATSRPLSATEKSEQVPGVRRDSPYLGRLRSEAGRLHLVTEDSNPGSGALHRPQPY